MAEVCPGAWLLNYTNPMAMICQLVYQGTPQHEGRRALPLRAGHDGDDRRPLRRAGRGGHLLRRRHQPPDVPLPPRARRREPLPEARRGDRAQPRPAAARARRHVPPARLLPDRVERALAPSTRPGTCATTPRSSGCASRSPTSSAAARRAWRSTSASSASSTRGRRSTIERSWEYASLIINSIETGEPCVIYGNVRNTGLITNLPADICVEVPCLVDRTGVNPTHVGDVRAAVRGAQPHVLERLRPDRARGARGAARPRTARRDARPEHGGELDARPDRRPRGRDARRLPRPAAGVAALSDRRPGPAELVSAAIDAAAHEGPAVVVGIDGPSGAGKSTLARELALLRDDVAIIEGDDFYRPLTESTRAALTPLEAVDLLFDWERLRDEALAPLLRGEEARYRRYDWPTGAPRRGRRDRRRHRRRAGRGRATSPAPRCAATST